MKRSSFALRVLAFGLSGWVALAALSGCADDRRSGTATDTQNTLAGIVQDTEGNPVPGVAVFLITDSLGIGAPEQVLLRSASLAMGALSDTILTTESDAAGRFSFDTVPATSFSIAVRSTQGVGLRKHLDSTAMGVEIAVQLQAEAWVSASIDYLPATDPLYHFSDHFRIGIVSNGQMADVVAGEEFVFGSIPAGEQELVFYPADRFLVSRLLAAGVPLDSLIRRIPLVFEAGDTLDLGTLKWRLPEEFYWEAETLAVRRMFAGKVVGNEGCPVKGGVVNVVLDPFGFSYSTAGASLPDSLRAVLDSTGKFRLPVPSQPFHLEILSFSTNPANLGAICGVANVGPLDPATDLVGDTLAPIPLQGPSTVRGIMAFVQDMAPIVAVGDHFRIGIMGTTRWIDIVPNQVFHIPGITSGAHAIAFYPGNPFIWTVADTSCPSRYTLIATPIDVSMPDADTLQLQGATYRLPDCFLQ